VRRHPYSEQLELVAPILLFDIIAVKPFAYVEKLVAAAMEWIRLLAVERM